MKELTKPEMAEIVNTINRDWEDGYRARAGNFQRIIYLYHDNYLIGFINFNRNYSMDHDFTKLTPAVKELIALQTT